MPTFTRNEKILLRSSERKDLLVEKYEDELSRLYSGEGEGEGRRTRQSSASSVVHSVFEKDRERKERDPMMLEKSLPRDTHWFETKVEFIGVKVPIRIPMTTFAEDVGEVGPLSQMWTMTLLISSIRLWNSFRHFRTRRHSHPRSTLIYIPTAPTPTLSS
jgi:hypothetical protein